MSAPMLTVAVLTISDTASLDPTYDKSGPAIETILAKHNITSNLRQIIPDEVSKIQHTVKAYSERGDIDWIITTGGTGFGVRDVTPEAIKPLLEREAPGLVHLLLYTSLHHTRLAALSRPVCGTIRKTLVTTLPGSVKAVQENLETLLSDGVVNHAIDLIRGGTGKDVHAALGGIGTTRHHSHDHAHHSHHGERKSRDASRTHLESSRELHKSHERDREHVHRHSHSHHHGQSEHHAPIPRTLLSRDPTDAASTRQRESPYPLISFVEALTHIQTNIAHLPISTQRVTPSLKGCVLAADVFAPSNIPTTPTTSVDGYALRSADPPGIYKVLTGPVSSLIDGLPQGHIYRINTGSPLPTGADTVIMVEDTRLISTVATDNGATGEEDEVETLVQVPPAENVRAAGSDVIQGDLVLPKREVLQSIGGEIGTLAFVGRKTVDVYKKPVVALLSTGDELVDLQTGLTREESGDGDWGGIFDTNRPSLRAALEGMGYEVVDLGIVRDNRDSHVEIIRRGLESADILLTTGGTSMGVHDLLKPVIEHQLDGTIHFGRVAIKPGKPTTFGTIPFRGTNKPIFALPGNPASALVTFFIFVVPALRLLGGWPLERCPLPRVWVELQTAMPLDVRMEFHRVVIKAGRVGLKAYSTGGQRSSRVASLSGANGFVILPPRSLGALDHVDVGERVEAVIVGELQTVES